MEIENIAPLFRACQCSLSLSVRTRFWRVVCAAMAISFPSPAFCALMLIENSGVLNFAQPGAFARQPISNSQCSHRLRHPKQNQTITEWQPLKQSIWKPLLSNTMNFSEKLFSTFYENLTSTWPENNNKDCPCEHSNIVSRFKTPSPPCISTRSVRKNLPHPLTFATKSYLRWLTCIWKIKLSPMFWHHPASHILPLGIKLAKHVCDLDAAVTETRWKRFVCKELLNLLVGKSVRTLFS